MTDLVTFIKARLDEDEAAASGMDNNARPPWDVRPRGEQEHAVWDSQGYSLGWCPDCSTEAHCDPIVAAHIVRWDPARALAEVAAKRGILALADCADGHYWLVDNEFGSSDDLPTGSEILRHLAQPYASHPDFDPAWVTE